MNKLQLLPELSCEIEITYFSISKGKRIKTYLVRV